MGVKVIYKGTEHNLVQMTRVVKSDDSDAKGEYHSINLDEWKEIECHIIDGKTINVGREYGRQEAIIFIQVRQEGRTEICNNFKLFHKQDWIEYRKERGRNKYKKTLIQKTGIIWVGATSKEKGIYGFKVFIENGGNHDHIKQEN